MSWLLILIGIALVLLGTVGNPATLWQSLTSKQGA